MLWHCSPWPCFWQHDAAACVGWLACVCLSIFYVDVLFTQGGWCWCWRWCCAGVGADVGAGFSGRSAVVSFTLRGPDATLITTLGGHVLPLRSWFWSRDAPLFLYVSPVCTSDLSYLYVMHSGPPVPPPLLLRLGACRSHPCWWRQALRWCWSGRQVKRIINHRM